MTRMLARSKTLLLCAALGAAALAGCNSGKGSPAPAGNTPAAPTTGGSQAAPAEANKVTAGGSSALLPLAKAAADQFESAHPNVTVEVSAGGSGQGLAQVEAGAVDIGDSDIYAPPTMKDLVDHRVAVVVFAVCANKGPFDADIKSLTKDQVVGIFSGKIKNWKEVGGKDEPITVLNRPHGSGTRAVFTSVVMGTTPLVQGTPVEDNSGTIRKTLQAVPGSISYLATSYLDDSIVAFGLDGVQPTDDDVVAGKYPVFSFEHMYTKGEAKGAVKDFLDFMLTDQIQNTIVKKGGYLPMSDMKNQQGHTP